MSDFIEQAALDAVRFWLTEVEPKMHFTKDAAFDAAIRARFAPAHAAIMAAAPETLQKLPREARLGIILILDQFARNMFRGQATAFAGDPIALALAQEIVSGDDMDAFDAAAQQFALMPFMHSEDLAVHEAAAPDFARYGNEGTQKFERLHRAVIERFGRYPHRNAALKRANTEAETEYIAANKGF